MKTLAEKQIRVWLYSFNKKDLVNFSKNLKKYIQITWYIKTGRDLRKEEEYLKSLYFDFDKLNVTKENHINSLMLVIKEFDDNFGHEYIYNLMEISNIK